MGQLKGSLGRAKALEEGGTRNLRAACPQRVTLFVLAIKPGVAAGKPSANAHACEHDASRATCPGDKDVPAHTEPGGCDGVALLIISQREAKALQRSFDHR